MTAVKYSNTSPYATSKLYGNFLDVMTPRPIPKLANDKLYIIDRFYHLRPDLLAYDLYQRPSLWWVFASRNPNSLKDPLFDFVTNNQIYIPDRVALFSALNI
jgi:hypothetical protein